MSYDPNIHLHLSLPCVYIFHLYVSAEINAKKKKKNTSQLSPDTIGGKTETSCLAARSRSIRSPECHPSTGPAKMRWRRSLLQYSLPSESPCVSTAKQLGAEDSEPFTTLWRYCNTWKQQPLSQVMTIWDGKCQKSWKCTQSNFYQGVTGLRKQRSST